ncbi:hypothetical protein LCGC14_1420740 [marine sediment metagenome]|uniref:HNH nuclease domain-containing protein n=1 Tax=marine sediment metagenome TaxID=412755 RepID=A0A0F9KCQ0_9ZZZZ
MTKVKEIPLRVCRTCDKPLERKRYDQRLEDFGTFKRRKYCNLHCANTRKTLTKHGYSWRARKHLKAACEACGETRRRIAHHIDQDITNCQPENIQTLCKWCHDFFHSMADRRGLMVAGKMVCLVSQRE